MCLNEEIRRQIHGYISKIREVIEPIDLKPAKRDALFAKLNALASEVDSDRTKTEAWGAFVLEVAGVGGKAARELTPVREMIDSIGNLIGKAREMMAEGLGLPSPGERKKLEPPCRQLPRPEAEKKPLADDLDDDIPF